MMSIGGWVIYYIAIGAVANGFAMFIYGPIGALDVAGALTQTSMNLFDLQLPTHGPSVHVPMWASLPGVIVPVVAALGIALWKIKNAADTGVGGAS
jgi:hypothetical protein